MQVDFCLNNIRCDTLNCKNFAKICVITSGHKGSLHLCEDCFMKMLDIMNKMKKQLKQIEKEIKK